MYVRLPIRVVVVRLGPFPPPVVNVTVEFPTFSRVVTLAIPLPFERIVVRGGFFTSVRIPHRIDPKPLDFFAICQTRASWMRTFGWFWISEQV